MNYKHFILQEIYLFTSHARTSATRGKFGVRKFSIDISLV